MNTRFIFKISNAAFLIVFTLYCGTSTAQRAMSVSPFDEFTDGDNATRLQASAIDDTHFILIWQDGVGTSDDMLGRIAEIDTANNDAVTYGAITTLVTDGYRYPSILVMNESTAVIFYEEDSGNDIGTAALISLDVSAKTISSPFSETVFAPGDVQFNYPDAISATKINDTQFVVAYSDDEDGDKGVAKVGTIAGTSLSFGSEQVFDADAVKHISIISIDPSTIIISYEADGNTYDIGESVIGHISGNDISWDGPFAFFTNNFFDVVGITQMTKISQDKFVIIYEHTEGGINFGQAIVGTISGGNTLTFGSRFDFETTQIITDPSVVATYENEFMIAYNGGSSSFNDGNNDSVLIMGEVDDTDITFGTPYKFSSTNEGDDTHLVFLNNAKVILAYIDESNTDDEGEIAVVSLPPVGPITWDGTTSTDWTTSSNWDRDEVPNLFDRIIIADASNDPIITTDVSVSNIEVESGGLLEISTGSLMISDDLILTGTIDVSSGASLIPLGSVSGTGSALIDRNTTFGISDGKYSIIGSPVVNEDTDALGSIVYSYDASVAYGSDGSERFISVGSAEIMDAGEAYFSANTGNITFTGIPNTGSFDMDLVYDETNDGGVTNAGFNLLSNPYASAISYDHFVASNDDIDGTIYLWDDGGSDLDQRTNADYVTVTSMGAVGGNTRSSDWDGYLRSTQGFFIKATTAGSAHFTSSMIDIGNNSDAGQFRTSENGKVRLSLNDGQLASDILIGYSENATTGMDRAMDAYKVKGNKELQLYSRMGDSEMAIQALPPSSYSEIVLGFDIAQAGEYVLQIDENSLKENTIYLIDQLTNTIIDLTETQSYSFYNDQISSSKRFSIILSSSPILGAQQDALKNNLIVFSTGSELTIKIDQKVDDAIVSIFDMKGSLIHQTKGVYLSNHVWSTSFIENGLFIIAVQSESDLFTTKFFK